MATQRRQRHRRRNPKNTTEDEYTGGKWLLRAQISVVARPLETHTTVDPYRLHHDHHHPRSKQHTDSPTMLIPKMKPSRSVATPDAPPSSVLGGPGLGISPAVPTRMVKQYDNYTSKEVSGGHGRRRRQLPTEHGFCHKLIRHPLDGPVERIGLLTCTSTKAMANLAPHIAWSEPPQARSERIQPAHGAPSKTERRSSQQPHHHPCRF